MSYTNTQKWGHGVRRIAFGAAAAMLSSVALLPGIALADDELTWSADTRIVLEDTGIALVIASGSAATSLVVTGSTVVVDVDGGDTFTIYAEQAATKLTNSAGSNGCNKVSGTSRLVMTAATAVTITPTESGCALPATSGGGGGSYSAPAATTCVLGSPNGGGAFTGDTSSEISWSTTNGNGNIASVLLSLSVDAGQTWHTIGTKDTTDGGTYMWTVPNTNISQAKVKVECRDSSGATLASDVSDSTFAVAANVEKPVAVVTPTGITNRASVNAALPANAKVDALVKLANDQAVYYIGLDGKRHPFPSSQAYFSWYSDFSKVKTISASEMASISLGKPILARPGSHWVKIQSDPKTYFVSPDGYTLRWIKDEATAMTLGGSDWNKNIIDVEPTYFTKYKMGADIDSVTLAAGWPAGSLVKGNDGNTWYITGTARREVLSSGMSANWFQNKFIEVNNGGWTALPIGEAISGMEEELSSLQNL